MSHYSSHTFPLDDTCPTFSLLSLLPTVWPANTLVRRSGPKCLRTHSAGSTLLHLWPTGSSVGIAPVDYDPVVLLKPFGLASRQPPCPPEICRWWLQVGLSVSRLSPLCLTSLSMPSIFSGRAHREGLRIAREQGARTFELQAAHALAKLYQRMNRAGEAHAVLALALEGFSTTSEFLKISEAQTLLEVLERDEAVKTELARRERRVQLQLAHGTALISARGYGAEETVKAFDRARELSAGVDRIGRPARIVARDMARRGHDRQLRGGQQGGGGVARRGDASAERRRYRRRAPRRRRDVTLRRIVPRGQASIR